MPISPGSSDCSNAPASTLPQPSTRALRNRKRSWGRLGQPKPTAALKKIIYLVYQMLKSNSPRHKQGQGGPSPPGPGHRPADKPSAPSTPILSAAGDYGRLQAVGSGVLVDGRGDAAQYGFGLVTGDFLSAPTPCHQGGQANAPGGASVITDTALAVATTQLQTVWYAGG